MRSPSDGIMHSQPPAMSSDSSAGSSTPSERYNETVDRFVEFWGTMASNWGINRTMARVYALLYCAERPLNTDDIMEHLQISRGSANMNLHSLVEWDLAEKTHVSNSRKDHYVAEKDVWQVTARIIEEREDREVRPVKARLQSFADHLVPDNNRLDDRPDADRHLYERLENLIDLIDVFEGLSEALLPLVKSRNEVLIKRLISLAQSVNREVSEEGEHEPTNE